MDEIINENNYQQNGEQPENISETFSVEEQQNLNTSENLTGSPINKFKSVEALKIAYENLEKEFTKKCQKLKELENVSCENANMAPQYETTNWDEKVCEFFSTFPQAKPFAEEISNVIKSDKEIACSNNSLNNAWTKVLASKYRAEDELIKDENFLNKFVYNNPEIADYFINQYLQKIINNKSATVISGNMGSATFSAPAKKPHSIKDAGKMVETLFK